jgi:hypothetical protein
VTKGNIGSHNNLISAAVALQVADAHAKCSDEEAIKKLFRSKPAFSNHPNQGPRRDIDDMLNVIDQMFVPKGKYISPFTAEGFQIAVQTYLPSSEARLLGEDVIAPVSERPGSSPVALILWTASTRHPQLGLGALLRISIPLQIKEDDAVKLGQQLNQVEYLLQTSCHGYGAWCSDHSIQGITYVTFLPAAVHRSGLVDILTLNTAKRAKWAISKLQEWGYTT